MKIDTFRNLKAKHRRLWCVTMLAIILFWAWPLHVLKWLCNFFMAVVWYAGVFVVDLAKEWFLITMNLLNGFPQTVKICQYLTDVWKGKAE